ncbi:MAG: AMIN domain-containing protein [Campylobacterota bacterium]
MKSSLLACILLLSPLIARENPFFAVTSPAQKVTSNLPENTPMLGAVSYSLPDEARILQEISLTYQNADGSIEIRKIDLNRAIDWHKPIVISQGGKSAQIPSNAKTSSSGQLEFVRFSSTQKTLRLASSVPLMRHFALSNPNRIVLDFSYSKLFEKTQKAMNAAPYLGAEMTYHGKFARMSITLDGRYDYTLRQSGKNIIIDCQ